MKITSLAGRQILVVEDEVLIALNIATALEKAGALVITASSVRLASQHVERDGLSAAVLDFGLHDGDANGLCARLNARGVPYILHSGYSHFGDACHRGVVVPKPVNPSQLVDAIIRLLGGPNDGSS